MKNNSNWFQRGVLGAVMLLFSVSMVFAQDITISGTVTGAEDGLPIPGVSVVEEGTTNGTITDINGNYSITAPTGAVVAFTFVGMKTQEFTLGAQTKIDVVLQADAFDVDEVVVTALGIKKEKKSLGYAMQEVKSEQLNSTMNPTVSGALQGKVAGVQISGSGSGLGGSSKITIRGNSSISGNNEPLWVIDGIPMDDSRNGDEQTTEFGAGANRGIDRSGGASDINPEDIESISVLKGPNAAALYGSRAANGVIVITTKKGTSKGMGIRYNGSVTFETLSETFEFQNKYGQGVGGVYAGGPNDPGTSWGPLMTGQTIDNWLPGGQPYKMTAQEDRLDDFYRTGISHNHNVSVDKAGEDYSILFSLGRNDSKGIFPGSRIEKNSYSIRASIDLTDKLKVDSKMNYINTQGTNRAAQGLYGAYAQFIQMPRHIRTQDLQPGYIQELQPGYNIIGQHVNWNGPNATYRNPYFQKYRDQNNDERERLIGFVSASYDFTKNLKLTARHGMDCHRTKVELRIKNGHRGIDDTEIGYWNSETNVKEQNTDFLLAFNDRFGDFGVSANFGGNIMNRVNEDLSAQSGRLNVNERYFLENGSVPEVTNSYTEQETQSLYGFAQIGYKDYLYLDITGRNDWSSTLPSENWSFFYPSVSMSWIATEMLDLPSWLTFAKVRGSYAFVGNSADAYMLKEVMTAEAGFEGNTVVLPSQRKQYPDLKPEQTKSTELGVDLKLFNNRLGLDFTTYKATTENQIYVAPTAPSSGYAEVVINAGEIENKGFEFMIYATPIQTKDFKWTIDFNYSKNESFVNEMSPEVKITTFGHIDRNPRMAVVKAEEGQRFGDIYGKKYRRHTNGEVMIGSNGLPMIDEDQKVGNIQADWTGALSTSFNYKSVSLGMVFDIKQGGDIVSMTESIAAGAGTAKITEERKQFVVDGVLEDGSKNTTEVSTENYYTHIGGRYGVAEEFLYDASYVQLRELSLGYTLPKSLVSKVGVQNARISFIGRNLFFLQNNMPGTSPVPGNDRTIASRGYELVSQPLTRTYGFNLSLKF
ncbi:MAG: SusC/RagA family TonB-linked outer membrane protein [Marinilabiliaceae bacterium]|nr:SusC/RagA family TonB-linked outer membrane protein [Marinilabiliaceae bacterium]